MKALTIAVAVVAVMAACAGLVAGTEDLGFLKVDPALLSIGGVGAMMAFVTARSAARSQFLGVFSIVFAAEYVLTGIAYLAARGGWWPSALAEAAPPASLCVTIAVFGLLVHLIGHIPVIRQIMQLADPYFATAEERVLNLGWLGSRRVSENRLASVLVMTVVVINQLQVAINVRLSFFNRDWFNAIQNKDAASFWSLLYQVFCFWAAIWVLSQLVEFCLESVLRIRWRRWLTERYYGRWLDNGNLYRVTLAGHAADNPDQRIAEDVKNFINSTYIYSISLLSTVSSLVSFSIILWTIPADFTIPGTEIAVPGLPFWVALVYSIVGTWLTHLIGKRLVQLNFQQERYEADFRFALARLREYCEQVALLRGGYAERRILGDRFGAVIANFYAIVSRTLKILTFTTSFNQANAVIPYIIVAPYFFLGKITLGQMTQTASAFGRVEAALTFFILRYQSLASFKAEVERLTSFGASLDDARMLNSTPPRIAHETSAADVELHDLTLSLPDGRDIVRVAHLVLKAGTTTLISGPSGSGKSTLFRAISGIWPYGRGKIAAPDGARIMLLPQRPYVPSGTLKTAASYPSPADAYDDDRVRDALKLVQLGALAPEIGRDDNWAQRLSGGEQQRLAIARALLAQPDWLFLDEATAALDEKLEGEIYRMLAEVLPRTTVTSIGHRSTLIALHQQHVEMTALADGIFTPTLAAATRRTSAG